MEKKFGYDQILDYWSQQAQTHKLSPAASWSDNMSIKLEINEILKYIENSDNVLDIGCGNGYSTVQFAAKKDIRILGLDICSEMIENAKKRLKKVEKNLKGQVTFDVGDIRNLYVPDESYNKLIITRVVINLDSWSSQKTALKECTRVLKPSGLLLLSEATLQGWNKLNTFRREWKLPDIPMPSFNRYLDQDRVVESFSSELELVELSNFASTYYVGTRVLKPLLIKALGEKIDVSDPNMEWNKWFAELPSWGDYGTQKLFIFRKK